MLLTIAFTFQQAQSSQAPNTPSEANALLQQGRFAEAEPLLIKLHQEHPKDAGVLLLLAKLEARVGKPAEASTLFGTAVKMSPQNAEGHLDFALLLADQEQWSLALEQLDAVLRLQPNMARAHYNKARVLADMNQPEEAVREFIRAEALDSSNPDIFYYHALLARDQGQLSVETNLLQRMLTLRSADAFGYYLLGRGLADQGRSEEAARALRSATSLDPQQKQARYLLSQLLRKSDPEESHRLLQSFLSLRENESGADDAKILGNQAFAAFQKERWASAIDLYRKALEVCASCTDQPALHRNLGLALAHGGDVPRAIKELQLALTLNPSDTDALRALEVLGAR